jgi:hypothetical protein
MTNPLVERSFDLGLWLMGAGHFVILIASFQVPYRLRWKEDLQQLMPFNRKLLWVQSGFTVLTIIDFGTLTLALHAELLMGDRAALGLACLWDSTGLRVFLWMRFTSPPRIGPKEQSSSLDTFS